MSTTQLLQQYGHEGNPTSHRAEKFSVNRWERLAEKFFEACEWAISKMIEPVLYWEPAAYREDFPVRA